MLKELAKKFNGRISSTNILDANVCSWTHPPGRSWEPILISGESFFKQLRFVYGDHKIRIFANNRCLKVEVMGSFRIQRLSINRANKNDPMLRAAEPLTINEQQYPTFGVSSTHPSNHKALLAMTSFRELVR